MVFVAAAAVFGLNIGAGITTVAVRDRVEVTSSTFWRHCRDRLGKARPSPSRSGASWS